MTLDAAEVLQVTQIAAGVGAEMLRNLGRGTGGAALPLPVIKLGTIGGAADAGDEVQVRADADPVAVPALNATGFALTAGDRVLVEWWPPGGVYVTNLLSRSSSGLWTPLWQGPGASAASVTVGGSYTRTGNEVTVHGKMIHGASSNTGSALQMGGLPFPLRAPDDAVGGISQHATGHYWSGSVRFPLVAIGTEGNSYVELWSPQVFGGTYAFLTAVGSGVPFSWTTGCEVNLSMTYETDAA